MSEVFLSVVVPAYNEEQRLPSSLTRLIAFLAEQAFPSEIIVADDGSTDHTVAVAQRAAQGLPPHLTVRVVSHRPNRGKGAAVQTGSLIVNGKYIFFTDADLPSPVTEIPRLLEQLEAGHDLAIGNRIQPDGRDMRASQPLYRRLLGKLYHLVAERLAVGGIADTQCGLKGFTREAAQNLFRAQRLTGWVFDAEILYLLATRWDYRIAQVPVAWSDVDGSRVQVTARQAIRTLSDLVSVRLVHRATQRPEMMRLPEARHLHHDQRPRY